MFEFSRKLALEANPTLLIVGAKHSDPITELLRKAAPSFDIVKLDLPFD